MTIKELDRRVQLGERVILDQNISMHTIIELDLDMETNRRGYISEHDEKAGVFWVSQAVK